MLNLFRHENGKPFDYIKEIKETDKLVIVRFKGAIDSVTMPIIKKRVGDARKMYLNKNAIADFKDVTHVDSATMAVLVMVLAERKEHGTRVGIINVPEMFKSYLKIDNLESLVKIYDSEEEAVRDLTREK